MWNTATRVCSSVRVRRCLEDKDVALSELIEAIQEETKEIDALLPSSPFTKLNNHESSRHCSSNSNNNLMGVTHRDDEYKLNDDVNNNRHRNEYENLMTMPMSSDSFFDFSMELPFSSISNSAISTNPLKITPTVLINGYSKNNLSHNINSDGFIPTLSTGSTESTANKSFTDPVFDSESPSSDDFDRFVGKTFQEDIEITNFDISKATLSEINRTSPSSSQNFKSSDHNI